MRFPRFNHPLPSRRSCSVGEFVGGGEVGAGEYNAYERKPLLRQGERSVMKGKRERERENLTTWRWENAMRGAGGEACARARDPCLRQVRRSGRQDM